MISSSLLLVLAVVVGTGPPSAVVVVDAVAVVVAPCRPGAGSACARQEAAPGAPECCKQGADPWPRLQLLTRSQVRSREVTRSEDWILWIFTLVLRSGGVVRPPVARLPLLLRHPLEGELALVLQVLRLLPPHHLQDCQVRRTIILSYRHLQLGGQLLVPLPLQLLLLLPSPLQLLRPGHRGRSLVCV